MEYQNNFLNRRHTEVYTWFRNIRIDNLEDWFYFYGYSWLWSMLVQLLHPIPKSFLTFSQHAQEWIVGVWVKWRKHYMALLAVGNCIKSQARPACSFSRWASGAGGDIGCALNGKKWNQPPSKGKQRLSFTNLFFFDPQQYFLQECAVNPQLLRPHL